MKKFLFVLLVFFPMIAFAKNTTQLIKKFDDWSIFKKSLDNHNYCVIISHPGSSLGFPGFRDKPYIGFTKVKKNKFTFSIYSGFIIDENEPIQMFLNNDLFYLKVFRDFFAYTYDSNDDERLMKVLETYKGVIRVRVVSEKGEVANDYYDIKGFKNALNFVKTTDICQN